MVVAGGAWRISAAPPVACVTALAPRRRQQASGAGSEAGRVEDGEFAPADLDQVGGAELVEDRRHRPAVTTDQDRMLLSAASAQWRYRAGKRGRWGGPGARRLGVP